MILSESKYYYIAVSFLLILVISIFLPPFLVYSGNESSASWLYNLHSYDHQWIYRSECLFKDQKGSFSIQDCIPLGSEKFSKISTIYTKNGDPFYNGIFTEYNQNQIGENKAEKVERDGLVGYKFANDTRDYAIYLPWFLVMAIYPYLFGKGKTEVPDWVWFAVALVPIGIDGTTQLIAGIFGDPSYYWLHSFGLKESTNLIRWITGGIAGAAMGYYFVPMVNHLAKKTK